MGILDQITQMKSQGIPDEEIVGRLQEQGVSPGEINDALSQSQIKNAVGNTEIQQPPMDVPAPNQQEQGNYIPNTQEIPEQEMYSATPQESYQQDAYNYPSEGINSDLIIEVAEQVFSEKIKKIQKQVEDTNEFQTLAQTKIENIEERLKRMETIIDKLQITILEKIGSYGKNLDTIKKEMSMMQNSFGKVVDQAVKGHHTHLTHHKSSSKKTTKKKTSKKK